MARKQIELKYTFTCDPYDLFFALYKPTALSNWVAETVDFDEATGTYTFHWADSAEYVRLIDKDESKRILKWKWIDGDYQDHEYTRFQVGDADESWYVDLYIEDFCNESDEEQQRNDWDEQMKRLSRVVS